MSAAASSLEAVATAAGLLVDWTDCDGVDRRVAEPTLLTVLGALGLPAAQPAQRRDALAQLRVAANRPLLTVQVGANVQANVADGACEWEHEDGTRVAVRSDAQGRVPAPGMAGYWHLSCGAWQQAVAVAPVRCFGMHDAVGSDARSWGLVLQPYATRGEHDGGTGDTATCARWAQRAARAGADALALGPVHAAGRIDAGYSPYSPTDRRYFEAIYAAPVDTFGGAALTALERTPHLRHALAELRRGTLIDWPAAAAAKWQWLETLQATLGDSDAATASDRARFEREGGSALAAHARFMHTHHGIAPPLYLFGQWLVTRGWQRLHADARRAGMRLGLVADLAVGFDPDGSEAHAAGDALLPGLVLGAPPDAFAATGQTWGVGTWSPQGLQRTGFAPFIGLLRAVMRDRGGLRIDHILGWQRLWVVPRGAHAGEGAYLQYPLQDLLNLVAIESWRHRCIVIGEDLGVVPEGIRDALAARGVMGMDVLPFCRDDTGAFLPPSHWRRQAVGMTGTHDLPTLVGWRRGQDLRWHARLGHLDDTAARAATARRQADIARLDQATGLPAGADDTTARLAALRLVAASPAPLALLPAEDALGLAEQVNLPGTVGVHPNWRQRLPANGQGHALDQAMAAFDTARRENTP